MNANEKMEILINVVNAKGYVVRQLDNWKENKFGKTDIVTIENGEHRITFITNVFYGINYFKIFQLDRYLQGKVYKSSRYFLKHIPLINTINGEVHIRINNDIHNTIIQEGLIDNHKYDYLIEDFYWEYSSEELKQELIKIDLEQDKTGQKETILKVINELIASKEEYENLPD